MGERFEMYKKNIDWLSICFEDRRSDGLVVNGDVVHCDKKSAKRMVDTFNILAVSEEL